ncbi:hypothetical protein Q3G72_007703 [Acer saccharum]|nr:hypothetical protein Q3G72_007703 [Acer saccharum]
MSAEIFSNRTAYSSPNRGLQFSSPYLALFQVQRYFADVLGFFNFQSLHFHLDPSLSTEFIIIKYTWSRFETLNWSKF